MTGAEILSRQVTAFRVRSTRLNTIVSAALSSKM
nr:MAG TPA: hypothetical protein [Caudoviricetes sp.]